MKQPSLFPRSSAEFSLCQAYRYELRRCIWPEARTEHAPKRPLYWCMLNPSTASGMEDDATIRRVIGFTAAWGFSDAIVVNMFALVSTDPSALLVHRDPIGPCNGAFLEGVPVGAPVLVAWGQHVAATEQHVRRVVRQLARPLLCLGTTASGAPRHPVRLPNGLTPVPWKQTAGEDARP